MTCTAWVLVQCTVLVRLVVVAGSENAAPFGAMAFFVFGLSTLLWIPLTRMAWRRAAPSAAREVVEHRAQPHLGLSGEVPPPTRW